MGTESKGNPWTLDMEWAGPFVGHSDPKEPKAKVPLNVSLNAVSLPAFIVIKVPETVPVLCGSVFALVPESLPLIFHILSVLGRR